MEDPDKSQLYDAKSQGQGEGKAIATAGGAPSRARMIKTRKHKDGASIGVKSTPYETEARS